MAQENTGTSEIKNRSIRLDDETEAKLTALAKECFNSKNECVKSLIQIYQVEQSRMNLPGLADEIDNFQMHLSIIQDTFLHVLQINKDTEMRVQAKVDLLIASKDKAIASLQESLDKAKRDLDIYKDMYREQKDIADKSSEDANKAYAALRDKEKVVTMQEEQIAELKADLQASADAFSAQKEQLSKAESLEGENKVLKSQKEEMDRKIEQLGKALEDERNAASVTAEKRAAEAAQELETALKNASHEKDKEILALQAQHQEEIFQLKTQHQEDVYKLKAQHVQDMQEFMQKFK